jgi:hypothetical protein
VVGAYVRPPWGSDSSTPEFADLETVWCQVNLAPMLRFTYGQGANCTFSGHQLASLALGSVPQQSFPAPAGSSKAGGGIPPSAIGNRLEAFINALHFVHDG